VTADLRGHISRVSARTESDLDATLATMFRHREFLSKGGVFNLSTSDPSHWRAAGIDPQSQAATA
jgi:hypothetical protein